MSRIQCVHLYKDIISLENLLEAWKEFRVGKKQRKDVLEFESNLMKNIIELHQDLVRKTYEHSEYEAFNISDPKPRNIHKATVRDRLLHHALYRKLYPFFDRTFISHSYSCRRNKGTHKAIGTFKDFSFKVSNNHTRTAWVLKCDVRKFFASIDHEVVKSVLQKYIPDRDILWLMSKIISSFYSTKEGVGLPLGNLTSQLLVNIYMNEFDQFVKHTLKAKYYVRYADDFVILSPDREKLENMLSVIKDFLFTELRLELHPDKVSIRSVASGIDFLGWVHFPNHCILRTTTKQRMLKRLAQSTPSEASRTSYLGMLEHGNTYQLRRQIGL